MAVCTHCSFELPKDAVFCPNCGNRGSGEADTLSGTDTIIAPDNPDVSFGLDNGKEFHGRYIIERRLGAGAMGVVYLAQDKVTSRNVAIKLINSALVNSTSAKQRFKREGLISRDVRHKNVIAMYDVAELDGQVYLVMEYLSGETLRKWLHRTLHAGEDIPFDTAVGIIRNILEGLAAAHAINVVHRDLKPENIMLMGNPLDGDCSLKILDFGIARAVGESVAKQLTTTSASTGTPLYMAPEQKTAADTVGPPADFYAVSVMFYELLIGVAPSGRWEQPSRERDDLPRDIDLVLEKGLSSRPRSRYQTAEEYLMALDVIGKDPQPIPPPVPEPDPQPVPPKPPVPGPIPPPAPAGRLSKTQRYAITLFGALAGLYIIGTWGGSQPPVDPPVKPLGGDVIPEPPNPTPPPEPDPPPPPPPPPPPSAADIRGRWVDELTGTRLAISVVDINQNGNSVVGAYYDYSSGIQLGTFSGEVQGTSFQYDWRSFAGLTGTGRGELDSDQRHMELEIRTDITGLFERHTLHRDHLPGQ